MQFYEIFYVSGIHFSWLNQQLHNTGFGMADQWIFINEYHHIDLVNINSCINPTSLRTWLR